MVMVLQPGLPLPSVHCPRSIGRGHAEERWEVARRSVLMIPRGSLASTDQANRSRRASCCFVSKERETQSRRVGCG